jgi:hypothetical protein
MILPSDWCLLTSCMWGRFRRQQVVKHAGSYRGEKERQLYAIRNVLFLALVQYMLGYSLIMLPRTDANCCMDNMGFNTVSRPADLFLI